MGVRRTPKPAVTCVHCGGPMPSPPGRGRPAIYCSGACRKAAFEARRTGKTDAYTVKIIDREVTLEHDLTECVTRVIGSPAACRRVLYALAQLAADGGLTSDPKWDSTVTAARRLIDDLTAPRRVQATMRGHSLR